MPFLSEDHIEMLLNYKISGKMCQFQTGHCSEAVSLSPSSLKKKKILKNQIITQFWTRNFQTAAEQRGVYFVADSFPSCSLKALSPWQIRKA